uniref:Uncharacterized protein n=1 Tax=Vespula pensylvanica TaxID=30213 RepID=A0A834P227_VESPE|nr:hypothetical protein H0235_007919 [Vespula pensylvanica]
MFVFMIVKQLQSIGSRNMSQVSYLPAVRVRLSKLVSFDTKVRSIQKFYSHRKYRKSYPRIYLITIRKKPFHKKIFH